MDKDNNNNIKNKYINDYNTFGNKYQILFWFGLLFIIISRNFFFGIDYFAYLDDYNTYGIFNRRNNDIWNDVIMHYGLYTFRPIAFFLDAYFYQTFWGNMWILLLILSTMYFFTCYYFYIVLKKVGIPFGIGGIIIISCLPFLTEAVYWIGASTRIVPSMFFSILSVYFMIKFIETDKKYFSCLFFILNLIANGFYEQTVIFNFIFTFGIAFFFCIQHLRSEDFKRENYFFSFITPFINLAIIGLYYFVFSNSGKITQRNQLITENLIEHYTSTFNSIYNLTTTSVKEVNSGGLSMGYSLLGNIYQQITFAIVVIFVVWLIATLIGSYIKRTYVFDTGSDGKKANFFLNILYLLFGIALALLHFAPFFLLQNSYMYLRSLFPLYFGLAIVFESIIGFLTPKRRRKTFSTIFAIILSVAIIPFYLIYVAEVHNYKLISETDNILMSNLFSEFDIKMQDDDLVVTVFNTKTRYPQTSSPRYENVTASDWGLIGMANATSLRYYFSRTYCVFNERYLSSDELDEILGGNSFYGYDDELNAYSLYAVYSDDNETILLYIEGSDLLFGSIIKTQERYLFKYAY